ncbi:uncharacterized protein LOC142972636 [Anticarsia gemmatalis]|uniref:uncharacterized protein LOC142972636 n=1 Tax=Anticarsia gemmatalis TaxID=129554 RepID=UPI003F7753FA
MLSKFLRTSYKSNASQLLLRRVVPKVKNVRYSDLIPPSQYDTPLSNKLKLGYVARVYWETIPLFVCTAISISLVFLAVIWACRNKVDVVFSTHSRASISRTMDLRNPSVHKIVIINQRYEPWPEMQDVLDKMTLAEKRALVRAQSCSLP